MPVARIISSSFEDALRFADYLRPTFDTVEIAQPGRSYDTAVDLEVNLEVCTPEQAWQQIAELGNQAEADIFVAPGTVTPAAENQSAGEMTAAADERTAAVSADAAQGFEAANCEVEANIAEASAMATKAAGSNGSATHPDEAAENVVAGGAFNWLSRTRESLRQWLAVRALLREIRQLEQRRLAEEHQRQRHMALQFERERRQQEAREAALARAAEQQQLALQEAERQRRQQEEAARLEQQASLRRQAEQEELRRQAEAEEAVRRGFFVEEILRRRAQEQAAQAMPREAEPVPLEFEAVPAESFAAAGEPAPASGWRMRGKSDRLKPAMALAGVTSILLMAALLGYAHRRPASPVPLAVLQRSTVIEQKVPFGPAVLPAPQPVAAPLAQVSAQSTPEVQSIPPRHGFRHDFRRVRVDSHEVDYVADDVTIRHFNSQPKRLRPRSSVTHPTSPAPITASSRSVKQISDME